MLQYSFAQSYSSSISVIDYVWLKHNFSLGKILPNCRANAVHSTVAGRCAKKTTFQMKECIIVVCAEQQALLIFTC
jgi:hypothetical protein